MVSVVQRIPAPILEYGKDPTAVLLKDEHQPGLAFYVLDQLRRRNQFCDVEVKMDSARLPAHKAVLASSSPYFMKLLTSDYSSPEILLDDPKLDVTALEKLVEFIYTSVLRITESSVEALCYAAMFLEMERIERACCKFMMKSLNPKNCIKYLSFVGETGYSTVEQECQEFITQHLEEVAKTPEFKSLSSSELMTLLQNSLFDGLSHQNILSAILQWVKHDTAARQQSLQQLLACIEFPQAELEAHLLKALRSTQVDIDDNYKLRVCSKNPTTPDQEKPENSNHTATEVQKTNNELLFTVGGTTKQSATNSVERYDQFIKGWLPTTALSRKRSHAALVTVDQKLYSIGGFDGNKRLHSVEVYDPQTDMWTEGPPLPTARSAFGVAVVDKSIYCIGGYDGSQHIASVEILDTKTNQWREGPKLSQGKSNIQAAAIGSTIYAVGGTDGTSRLKSVEKLSLDKGYWSLGVEMNVPRSRPGVVALNGKVYVVGGYSGSEHLSSVECYEPQIDQWILIESMGVPRNSPAVTILNGCIHVAGGYSGRKLLKTVEMYDHVKRQWNKVASMHTARCDFGLAVLQSTVLTGTWT